MASRIPAVAGSNRGSSAYGFTHTTRWHRWWRRWRALDSRTVSPRSQPSSALQRDRKSTRLNSSHQIISYAVFCLKKKTGTPTDVLRYHNDNYPTGWNRSETDLTP